MTEKANPFATYDYRKTAEYKRHRRVMDRFRNMTLEEKLQTMVDAGILNEDLELTERYGGNPSKPKTEETSPAEDS